MQTDRAAARLAQPVLLALVVAVPTAAAVALRLQRLALSSDSVAQQSVVRTWLDVGHRVAYLPPDTWLLKLPLYLLAESAPLSPGTRVLAESLALALTTFALLAWGMHALLRLALPPGARIPWALIVLPAAWLGTAGGGLGEYLAALPNSRNVELGLSFVIVALLGRYLGAGPRARDAARLGVVRLGSVRLGSVRQIGAAAAGVVALGLLWADDPYVAFLVGVPLTGACLAWYLLRSRDRRLLAAAAVLAASLGALGILRRAMAAAGLQVVPDATGVTLSPAQIASHLPILWPALASQVGLSGPVAASGVPARVAAAAVLLAGVPASGWLTWQGWRSRNLPLTFVGAHWPVVTAGVLVNRTIYDFHAGRYLVLAVFDLVVSLGLAAALLRSSRPRLAALAGGLLTVALAANLAAEAFDPRPPAPRIALQEQTLAVLEGTGAAKGYSAFWSADLYTHQSGGALAVSDVVCSGRHRLVPRYWLTDSARATRPSRRTFVLWDPAAPDQRGCSVADLEEQFGHPLQTRPAPTGGVVLVFGRDVTSDIQGADGHA